MLKPDIFSCALTSHRHLIDRRISVDRDKIPGPHSPGIVPSDDQLSDIALCLKKRKVLTPVLLAEDQRVLAGAGLAEAAILLGSKTVPAYRLADLSADDLRIYAKSLLRYADIAQIDREVFRADVDRVVALAETVDRTDTPNSNGCGKPA